jgi:hypothetical protein
VRRRNRDPKVSKDLPDPVDPQVLKAKLDRLVPRDRKVPLVPKVRKVTPETPAQLAQRALLEAKARQDRQAVRDLLDPRVTRELKDPREIRELRETPVRWVLRDPRASKG